MTVPHISAPACAPFLDQFRQVVTSDKKFYKADPMRLCGVGAARAAPSTAAPSTADPSTVCSARRVARVLQLRRVLAGAARSPDGLRPDRRRHGRHGHSLWQAARDVQHAAGLGREARDDDGDDAAARPHRVPLAAGLLAGKFAPPHPPMPALSSSPSLGAPLHNLPCQPSPARRPLPSRPCSSCAGLSPHPAPRPLGWSAGAHGRVQGGQEALEPAARRQEGVPAPQPGSASPFHS